MPQGSLLGPLLFNIFINDISSCFQHSQFLLYADDMKVFRTIKDLTDCNLLQEDLDRLAEYCHNNRLDLNVSKCSSITFSRSAKAIQFSYKLKAQVLIKVTEVRDLGVIHDTKLTYNKHLDYIINKANRSLGFIRRVSSEFTNIKTIKILYCSYVRSSLEYCSQVWNPQYHIYINRLESIQKRFIRYIQFKCKTYDPSYESRAKRFHLLPLFERRRIADIVSLLKIAQNKIDSPVLLSKIYLKVPSRSSRIPSLLYTPFSSTNYRKNSFLIRTSKEINTLNDIPELDFDLFNTSVDVLKRIMTRHWFDAIT